MSLDWDWADVCWPPQVAWHQDTCMYSATSSGRLLYIEHQPGLDTYTPKSWPSCINFALILFEFKQDYQCPPPSHQHRLFLCCIHTSSKSWASVMILKRSMSSANSSSWWYSHLRWVLSMESPMYSYKEQELERPQHRALRNTRLCLASWRLNLNHSEPWIFYLTCTCKVWADPSQ